MFNNEEIIRRELESLRDDIRQEYIISGKKASGEFERGLTVSAVGNKGTLSGFGYLAGRPAGNMPVVQKILDWVKIRGIQPYIEGMTVSQLAWAIAKHIANHGTNPERHLKIYEKVVTPERIQSIIDKVGSINLQAFIDEITTDLRLLTKDL